MRSARFNAGHARPGVPVRSTAAAASSTKRPTAAAASPEATAVRTAGQRLSVAVVAAQIAAATVVGAAGHEKPHPHQSDGRTQEDRRTKAQKRLLGGRIQTRTVEEPDARCGRSRSDAGERQRRWPRATATAARRCSTEMPGASGLGQTAGRFASTIVQGARKPTSRSGCQQQWPHSARKCERNEIVLAAATHLQSIFVGIAAAESAETIVAGQVGGQSRRNGQQRSGLCAIDATGRFAKANVTAGLRAESHAIARFRGAAKATVIRAGSSSGVHAQPAQHDRIAGAAVQSSVVVAAAAVNGAAIAAAE